MYYTIGFQQKQQNAYIANTRQYCREIDRILIYDNLNEDGININNALKKTWGLSHKHAHTKKADEVS